jgi:restriction system protein
MIPDFQTIMLPVLEFLKDKNEHTLKELILQVSDRFKISDIERKELLPSGGQTVISNRVGWTRTYLKKAGLLASPRRATFVITEAGLKVLDSKPDKINIAFLKTLPEFKKWQDNYASKEKSVDNVSESEITIDKTPQELLDISFQQITTELRNELLDVVKSCSPLFFENLVVDLIVKMGYGGSKKEAGMAVGKSGDGGIDGIINEDKLGLDTIYIQAKRWENTVPVKEVRDFAGALLGQKARKGIFITTSEFPKSAYEYVKKIEHKIILIDGCRLTELMIENNLGLSVQMKYEVKRIDTDYFEEI